MMYTTQNIGRKSNKNVTRVSHPQRFFSISSIASPALFFFLSLDYLFSTWYKIFSNIATSSVREFVWNVKPRPNWKYYLSLGNFRKSKDPRIDVNFELNNFAIVWQAWKGRERKEKEINKFIFGGKRVVQKRSFKCISRIIN